MLTNGRPWAKIDANRSYLIWSRDANRRRRGERPRNGRYGRSMCLEIVSGHADAAPLNTFLQSMRCVDDVSCGRSKRRDRSLPNDASLFIVGSTVY